MRELSALVTAQDSEIESLNSEIKLADSAKSILTIENLRLQKSNVRKDSTIWILARNNSEMHRIAIKQESVEWITKASKHPATWAAVLVATLLLTR